MEPETRQYLDEPWTAEPWKYGTVSICGSDGDPLFLCDAWNAAHFLTPAAMAEYLIELHDAARRETVAGVLPVDFAGADTSLDSVNKVLD